MAKLTREAQKIFASSSNTNEKAVFGSMKTGSPVYTTDLATLQSSDYLQGWQNALLTGKAPFLEEMNGVQYGLSKQIAYLLQAGISEWLSTDTYYTDDYCRVGHNIYYSNSDNNIGNNPATDNVNWTHAGNYETATSTTSGLTKLYASTGSNTDGTMTQQAITSALPVQATASNLGTVKLYATTGTNTDGAMTQSSATSLFQGKLSAMGSASQGVYVSSAGTLSLTNTIPSTTSSVTSGSTSALTSGGAYTSLITKQDKLYQAPTTVSGSTIALSTLSNFYSLNVSSATTITFDTSSITLTSNVVTFELRINMTAVSTITFPTNVEWLEAPDMSEVGVYYFVFRQVNNSGYWIANLQGKWSY